MTYFYIYLAGSIIAVLLIVIRLIIHSVLAFISNEHIFIKNISKIGLYKSFFTGEIQTRSSSYLAITVAIVIDTVLSWVSVFLLTWSLIIMLASNAKMMFNKPPSKIAEVIYPLKHSLLLSPEAIWARCVVIIFFWEQPSLDSIYEELSLVENRVPDFNRKKALELLRDLNHINVLQETSALLADGYQITAKK